MRGALFTLTAAVVLAAPAASSAATCATDPSPVPGGDWRSYGRDATGARHQTAPNQAVGPVEAPKLEPAWAVRTPATGGSGTFQSTPTVADGCVFLGSSTGWLYALNANTGDVVWKTKVEVRQPGLLGSGAVGAPTVRDGKVYFLVSQAGEGAGSGHGPYVVALDQATGSVAWQTVVEEKRYAYTDSSPILYEDVLFAGFNGDETYADSRGGYALLDPVTGEILKKTYTVGNEYPASGTYIEGANGVNSAGGGSVWATPVVDESSGYAYVGTANPTGDIEAGTTNAIIKVDLDRTRAAFGQIVDHVKGTPDSVSPVNPLCGQLRNPGNPNGDGALSIHAMVGCTRADYDFGASPNMLEINGRLAVAELQKSGYVHAAYIDGASTEKAWSSLTGPGFFYDNLATSATDGERIYVTAGPPGQIWALDADTGNPVWAAPIGDQLHFQSVTVANGVVYTIDSLGWLWAYDAENGTPLLHRELSADNGGDTTGFANPTSVGVAVARNSVYLADGDFIMRYLPTGDGSGAGVPKGPGLPEIPASPDSAIVAAPQAQTAGYVTRETLVTEGGNVTFANADTAQHDVVSLASNPDGSALFRSDLIGLGQTTAVNGVPALPPGDYGFICSLHGGMRGNLKVVERPASAPEVRTWRSFTDPLGRVSVDLD